MKIRSFAHKGLKRFYADDNVRGIPPDAAGKLRKMLAFLDNMQDPEELHSLPAWKAHTLSGDRKGVRSMEPDGHSQSAVNLSHRQRKT